MSRAVASQKIRNDSRRGGCAENLNCLCIMVYLFFFEGNSVLAAAAKVSCPIGLHATQVSVLGGGILELYPPASLYGTRTKVFVIINPVSHYIA